MIKLKLFLKKIILKLNLFQLPPVKYLRNKRVQLRAKKAKQRFLDNRDECFIKTIDILKNNNVDYWLDFGTLLGAVRDGDFIKHDYDMDLGILFENEEKQVILEKELQLNGLEKIREFHKNGKLVEETYSLKGANIDLFYYVESDKQKNKIISYSFYREEELKLEKDGEKFTTDSGWKGIEYTVDNEGTKDFKFKGIVVKVPKDEIKYIKDNYGENYAIPDPDWSLDKAPNCKEVVCEEVKCTCYNGYFKYK